MYKRVFITIKIKNGHVLQNRVLREYTQSTDFNDIKAELESIESFVMDEAEMNKIPRDLLEVKIEEEDVSISMNKHTFDGLKLALETGMKCSIKSVRGNKVRFAPEYNNRGEW